jgi:hypothetical protein
VAECDKYIMMISSLADSELGPEQEAELCAHMESCSDCRRIYDAFKGISGAMSDDLIEPPESLSKSIMHRIEAQEKSKRPRFFVFGRFTAAAACLVLILFGASRFGWFDSLFRSDLTRDAAPEETVLSGSNSEECEDVQEGTTKKDSDYGFSHEQVEEKSSGSDGMMFTAPMTGNSGNSTMYAAGSGELNGILSGLFASGEIKVFEGSYDKRENVRPLITLNDNKQTELSDILGCSGTDIVDPELSDTPDYTLLFPDATTISLWSVDGSIYCILGTRETVYLAAGTMEEFKSFLDSY